jgi:hypothetical protein
MKKLMIPQLVAALVGLAVTASAAQAQHLFHRGKDCADPCCDQIKTVCRPEVGTKKTTKYWYDCKCEDLCLPKCGCPKFSLGCLHKGCGHDCCPAPVCDSCHDCECPRVVKKLIKHPKVVEECETKCVPEKVLVPYCPPCPPCPPPCGTIYHGHPVIVAPAGPAKPAEMLPPPKIEKK